MTRSQPRPKMWKPSSFHFWVNSLEKWRRTSMNLITKATEAQSNAYAPYSKFQVGCAVMGGSGKIYQGCNVENSSYGATICAERSAIAQAVAHGETKITSVALISSANQPVSPCGI